MSLAVTYSEIREAVGRLLGLQTSGGWDEKTAADVAAILRAGQRRFYYYTTQQPPDRPVVDRWSWSFMRPLATLAIESGTAAYTLPDDFAELLDDGVTISTTGASRLSRVSEEEIRSLPAKSGTPLYYALRPLAPLAQEGPQRWQLLLYPTPNAASTASYRYSVIPAELSDENQYPLGGAMHGQCLLESCLAEAERTLNDEEGIHCKRFLELVAASIKIDQQLAEPSDGGIWPLEHEATDLTVTKAYLKRLIGRELGFGSHPGVWTHKQQNEVKVILETGQRKFYSPMVLPRERYPHSWSFARPTELLTTVSGQAAYDLPRDFAMFASDIVHAPSASALYPPIKIVSAHQIHTAQQYSTATGRPMMACLQTKPIDPAGVTQWEVLLSPTPDAAYDLRFQYELNPVAIPEDANLPLGGQPHAQTIIEAVLAAAEEHNGEAGLHSLKFLEELTRSVNFDRKASSPHSLGVQSDNSDRPEDGNWNHHGVTVHSFNGIFY